MKHKNPLRIVADAGNSVIAEFGVVTGESPLLAAAQQHLAERIFQNIASAISDRTSPKIVFDGFKTAVYAHFIEALTGSGIFMSLAWMERLTGKRTPDDFALLAWQSYVKSHLAWCDRLQLSKTVQLITFNPSDEVAEKVVLAAGGQLQNTIPSALGGLDLAWDMAKLNLDRVEFRVAATFTLMSAARGRKERLEQTADLQAEALLNRLWMDRQIALSQFFAVGTLVGETARVELKARAKAMYADNFSVMHLVSVDGVLPGRWLCDDEKKLRDDIAHA